MPTVGECSGLRGWLSQADIRKGLARDSRAFLDGWPEGQTRGENTVEEANPNLFRGGGGGVSP